MKTNVSDSAWQKAVDIVVAPTTQAIESDDSLGEQDRARIIFALREQATDLITKVFAAVADDISAQAWDEGAAAAFDSMLGNAAKVNPYKTEEEGVEC